MKSVRFHTGLIKAVTILIKKKLFFCRWSDKSTVDFQNFAEGTFGGGLRNNGLCVSMSSSSGKPVHVETLTLICLLVPALRSP